MALVAKRTYLLGMKKESSFGVEATIASADLIEVLEDRDLKGSIDQVDNNVMRNTLSNLAKINTIRRAGGAFSVQALGGGASDPSPQYGAAMEASFGVAGVLINADKTAQVGCSVSGLELDNITDLETGCALGWLNTDSELEVCWITATSSSGAAIEPDLSGAPSNGETIYKSKTYKMQASGYDDSYTLKEFYGESHDMTYLGCKVATLEATFNTGEIVTFKVTIAGKDFEEGTDDAPSYTEPTNDPIVGLYGRCILDNTEYDISSFAFTVNNGQTEKLSLKSSGIDDMKATNRSCDGSFDVYFDTNQFLTDFKNATKRKLFVQAGKTVGNTVATRMPQIKYTDVNINNEDLRKNPCTFDAEPKSAGLDEIATVAFL